MKPLVALLDSGVDPTHEAFGAAPPSDDVRCAIDELNAARHSIISGRPPAPARLKRLLERVFPDGRSAAADGDLLPGRCFAGYSPPGNDEDGAPEDSTLDRSTMDLTGHGTAAAGILLQRGFRVLPVKVSFTAVNAVSMEGLVDACVWISSLPMPERPEFVLWPFGTTEPDSAEVFQELARLLDSVGVTVCASGRGVFQNISEKSQRQYPSDLPSVIAVDETLTVTEYAVEATSSDVWRCRHLAGTAPLTVDSLVPLERLVVVETMDQAEQLLVDAGVRPMEFSPGSVVVVACASRYAYPRAPVPHGWTVLLGKQLPMHLSRFLPVQATYTVEPPIIRSKGPATLAHTGVGAPVACTVSGYGPAYGSSFALPAGMREAMALARAS
jgi:hypothetical protein